MVMEKISRLVIERSLDLGLYLSWVIRFQLQES